MHKKLGFSFTKNEVLELILSWTILSIAFTILYYDAGVFGILKMFLICFTTVGLGFVLHELGHKFMANYYGFPAEFHANFQGLGLAVLMSFAHFIYVAPGAVYISGHLSKKQDGLISVMGPIINVILGSIFLLLYLLPITGTKFWLASFWLGYNINVWVGLFNLIPSRPFDGKGIMTWNKTVYFLLVIITGGFFILSYIL